MENDPEKRISLQLQAQIEAFRAILRNAPLPESFHAYGVDSSLSNLSSPPNISSLAPISGFDPCPSFDVLEERRAHVVRSNMFDRLRQLRSLPCNLPRETLIDAVMQLKSLEMFSTQQRIRAQMLEELRKASVLSATAELGIFKRSLRNRDLAKQQHEEEDLAKAKEKSFLAALLNHAREFHVLRAERRNMTKVVAVRVVREWEKGARKRQTEEERLERERVQKLREGDEEGYLKLLQKKKDARLDSLLQQTADFMNKISAMVQLEKDRAAGEDGAELVPVADKPQEEQQKAADASKKGYVETRQSYYRLAHTVQEDVALQPNMLKFGKLREYQLQGLQWLVSLYNNNLNGILADEMGLGKTIQTISLIAYLIEKKNNKGPFLVIVPLSTLSNWKDEFDRWTPEIDMVVYNGSPNRRKDLWSEKLSTGRFHVMITTFEYVMRDKQKLGRIHWNFLIVDEGHRMKNSQSKLAVILSQNYRPKHRLLLTGTPLQNSLPELWSLLNFLLPNIFNSVDSFEKWFNAPFETTGEKMEMSEEETLLIINRLHSVLRPFLLRRLKKDVEKQLPDKLEKVIRCDQSEWQKMLYDRMMNDRTLMTEGGVKGLQNRLMQLRKICNHPYLFDEKAGYDIDDRLVRAAGKFVLLDNVLPKLKAAGHRVLIFSQMTSLMNILVSYFQLRNYAFLRLDGATKQEERRERMALWNEPNSPYFVFVLSTRAGGLGLNLQTADTVILFDSDWNPQADLQAQDRAHRIGQTKRVLVLRLITAHTIEERILETATRKLGLDQKVIGAGLFNQNSDAKDRKKVLEELLKAESNKDDSAEVHSAKEINKRLSRNEQEYEMFKRMDMEREKDIQRRLALGEAVPAPMMTRDELPAWLVNPGSVQIDYDNLKAKDLEGIVLDAFGRGKRRRATVDYSDQLDEEEFCILMDRGADEEEIKQYIAERNAKRAAEGQPVNEPVAEGEEEDSDEEHVQDEDEPVPKEERKRSRVSRIPTPEEQEATVKGRKLVMLLKDLKDGSGRKLSEKWMSLASEEETQSKKRGRPSGKTVDLNTIIERLNKHRYKRFSLVVADVDKMFNNILEATQQGSMDRNDASQGLIALHKVASAMDLGQEPPNVVAYEQTTIASAPAPVVAVKEEEQQQQQNHSSQQQQQQDGGEGPSKKLKIKLVLKPTQ